MKPTLDFFGSLERSFALSMKFPDTSNWKDRLMARGAKSTCNLNVKSFPCKTLIQILRRKPPGDILMR